MEAVLNLPMTEPKAAYKTVKLRIDVYEKAKKVAVLKGVDLMVYLSEAMEPIVERDLKSEGRKISGPDKSDRK